MNDRDENETTVPEEPENQTAPSAKILPPVALAALLCAIVSLLLIIGNILGLTVIQNQAVILVTVFGAALTAVGGVVCAAISLKKYKAQKRAKVVSLIVLIGCIVMLAAVVILFLTDLIVLIAIGIGKGVGGN